MDWERQPYDGPYSRLAAFSGDGRRLLSVFDPPDDCQLWCLPENRCLGQWSMPVTREGLRAERADLDRQGVRCLLGVPDGSALLLMAQSGQLVARLQPPDREIAKGMMRTRAVRFSHSGALAAVGFENYEHPRQVHLWDTERGMYRGCLEMPGIPAGWHWWDGPHQPGMVVSLAFSPDDRYLFAVCVDKQSCIWDLQTGQAVQCPVVPPVVGMGLQSGRGVWATADGRRWNHAQGAFAAADNEYWKQVVFSGRGDGSFLAEVRRFEHPSVARVGWTAELRYYRADGEVSPPLGQNRYPDAGPMALRDFEVAAQPAGSAFVFRRSTEQVTLFRPECPLQHVPAQKARFSSDGAWLLLEEPRGRSVVEVATGKVIWTGPRATGPWDAAAGRLALARSDGVEVLAPPGGCREWLPLSESQKLVALRLHPTGTGLIGATQSHCLGWNRDLGNVWKRSWQFPSEGCRELSWLDEHRFVLLERHRVRVVDRTSRQLALVHQSYPRLSWCGLGTLGVLGAGGDSAWFFDGLQGALVPRLPELCLHEATEVFWQGPGGPYPAMLDPRSHNGFAPARRDPWVLHYWSTEGQYAGVGLYDLDTGRCLALVPDCEPLAVGFSDEEALVLCTKGLLRRKLSANT